jgi:hypothetical protein
MQTTIYQNCLALDYLLAEEGGICGTFNWSDCCLHIDDIGQAVIEIATNIRKMAYVPTQVWKRWDPNSLLSGWFSALGRFETDRNSESSLGSMSDVTLPVSPGIDIYQDH